MSSLFTATTAVQVEEALARGVNIEEEGGWMNKKTPLIAACERGELEVVDCLLNHGADPTHRPPSSFFGPLQWAAWKGHAAILERLIKAGVDINDNQGGEGETALILASRDGHVDVVDFLLSQGADTETTDMEKNTALIVACMCGKIDVVLFLSMNVASRGQKTINNIDPSIPTSNHQGRPLVPVSGLCVGSKRQETVHDVDVSFSRGEDQSCWTVSSLVVVDVDRSGQALHDGRMADVCGKLDWPP